MKKITAFRGEYAFLSNMYEHPQFFRTNLGIPLEFQCAEAAFQARKTVNPSVIQKFTEMTGPQTKAYGRKISLIKHWDIHRVDYMKLTLQDKFADPLLRQKLLDTGDAQIIEQNWWHDDFWGVCTNHGQNQLGKLLMEIRNELKERTEPCSQ